MKEAREGKGGEGEGATLAEFRRCLLLGSRHDTGNGTRMVLRRQMRIE